MFSAINAYREGFFNHISQIVKQAKTKSLKNITIYVSFNISFLFYDAP